MTTEQTLKIISGQLASILRENKDIDDEMWYENVYRAYTECEEALNKLTRKTK